MIIWNRYKISLQFATSNLQPAIQQC